MPSRVVLLTALAVLLPGWDRADAQTLRKLCIDTPVIALAAPLDPTTPTRFKVLLPLRGKGLRVGQTLAPAGLTARDVQTFEEPETRSGKPRPRRISQALLFLTNGETPRLILGGLRLCTEDGQVLAPVATGFSTQKTTSLEVRPRLNWWRVVARVRSDIATVDRLQAYRRFTRPHRRAQALLDWVRRHRGEFSAGSVPGLEDEMPAGWEDLQIAIFDWAVEGASPTDGWEAVRLYAELNNGELLQLRSPIFSSPQGRAFLAAVAANEKLPFTDRARALRLLGERITLWPSAEDLRRGARALPAKEQEGLLDQLARLLENSDETYRPALVRTIARLSIPEVRTLSARRSDKALPALLTTYRASKPGAGRDELSAAVCALAPPNQWKELTGNPAGVCAWLGDMERTGATVSFWLHLRSGTEMVYEEPVLVLEKLGTLGFVSETKRLPLRPINLERAWALGWNAAEPLAVRQDLPALAPGTIYRLRVEGTIGKGKDKQKWQSEPKRFLVPTPKYPTPGRFGGRTYGKW
jgi:hypothetical protein